MSYKDISVSEFKEGIDNNPNAVIIDVRTPEEIEDSCIENYIAINIMDASFLEKIEQLDKSKAYYIYCRSGNRSGHACRIMASRGFGELYNLAGGIIAWENQFA
jgi:rhodanese-related sulfurtransferase